MRVDGRKYDEIRKVTFEPNFINYPEGSVLISMGNTKVICNASIQEDVPRWMEEQRIPGGWITAEYSLLPRSTHERTSREIYRFSGRTHEIRRTIGRSLRAAVDLHMMGKYTCIIDCDVIQADGGTRTAAITGGYLALRIALNYMMTNGLIDQNPIISPIAAISTGVVDGNLLLDLCYEEDRRAQVDINVVINANGEYVDIQGTAEGAPFSRSVFNNLLDLAYRGVGMLLYEQEEVLRGLGIVG